MIWKRRAGEIGVVWKFDCKNLGKIFDLSDAASVHLLITGGSDYTCVLDSLTGGLCSYTNTADDIAVGAFKGYLKKTTTDVPAKIYLSETLDFEIEAPGT